MSILSVAERSDPGGQTAVRGTLDVALAVTLLGVGKAFTRRFRQSNFLIDGREGLCCLLDCGFTAPAALDDLGVFDQIGLILLTHCHMDHVGGLEELALRRRLAGLPAPLLVAPDPIVVQVNTMFGDNLRWVGDEGPFEVIAAEEDRLAHFRWRRMLPRAGWWEASLGGLGSSYHIVAFPVRHVPHLPTFGYRLERRENGHRAALLFSGDTARPVAEPGLVGDVDLLFHDIGADPVHAGAAEVAAALGQVPARILGYHYADDPEPGPVTLAAEGVRYLVP